MIRLTEHQVLMMHEELIQEITDIASGKNGLNDSRAHKI